MLKIIRKIALFSLLILVFTIPFEIFLRYMETDYKEKLQGFKDNMETLEVLIVGNSHAINGIDPTQFEHSTYNMAGHNQSLYFDKRIVLKHIDKLTNLKYVLVPCDYHSFYFSSQGIRDTWTYYAYDIRYKENKEFFADVSYFWFGYSPRIAMSIVKAKLLVYIYGSSNYDLLINGYMPIFGSDSSSFKKNSIAYQGKWFNNVVQPSNEREYILADLEDFILQLKKRNIKPILYTMPMYNEVYQYLDTSFLKQNQVDINTIVSRHQIPYLNLTSDSILAKEFFYDTNHLNSRGAKNVSHKINDFIQELEK